MIFFWNWTKSKICSINVFLLIWYSKGNPLAGKLDWSKLQGVLALSDKSSFDVTATKFGQISKVKVFSCSQMKKNLF